MPMRTVVLRRGDNIPRLARSRYRRQALYARFHAPIAHLNERARAWRIRGSRDNSTRPRYRGTCSQVAEMRYILLGVEPGEWGMLRSVLLSAALLSMLGGCAAPRTEMVNNKGQKVECSAFGMGVLGTLVAVSMQQTCVDQHNKQGFHQVPAAPASTTAPATTSSGQTK
jgi:hypothetical protein